MKTGTSNETTTVTDLPISQHGAAHEHGEERGTKCRVRPNKNETPPS